MSGYTPKPWRREGEYIYGDPQYGLGGEACVIAHVEHGPDAPDNPTAHANGDLMAMAPEMLEVLRKAEKYMTISLQNNQGNGGMIDATLEARAVIAKAKAGL